MSQTSRFEVSEMSLRGLMSLEPGMSRRYAYSLLSRHGANALTIAVINRHLARREHDPIERWLPGRIQEKSA